MCKICRNENLNELKDLYCVNCPLLTNIPLIEGLKYLNCGTCPLLTNIPNIEGLQILECHYCPLITNIPVIEGLRRLSCSNCVLLTNISHIEGLKYLDCSNCPLLMYAPKMYIYDDLFQPFKTCKYKISKKMLKLYNNIFKLWKYYKLNKYIKHLDIIYGNPELPYMKYYINNELYNMDKVEEKEYPLRIGYMNSKNELIWYKLKD